MGTLFHPVLILQGVLATLHMVGGTLLYFLFIVAGIVYVLVAKLAFHESLLFSTCMGGQRGDPVSVPPCSAYRKAV